jgi:hypothetical protein
VHQRRHARPAARGASPAAALLPLLLPHQVSWAAPVSALQGLHACVCMCSCALRLNALRPVHAFPLPPGRSSSCRTTSRTGVLLGRGWVRCVRALSRREEA